MALRPLSLASGAGSWAVLISALLLGVAAPVTVAAAPPGPTLAFETDALIASGLTPNGEALLFSVAREPGDYLTRVVRRAEILPTDAAGTLVYHPSGDSGTVPLKAVWVAVDLTTGEMAVSPTPGFPREERPFPAEGLRRGPAGQLDRLVDRLGEADLLLVRPVDPSVGAESWGAWHLYSTDGSRFDRDRGVDESLEMALEDLEPIGSSPPPPEAFAAGDVVVLIHPSALSFFGLRLTS